MQAPEPAGPANPLVAALLAGSAPRQLKISAARGVLPLMRAELVKILIVLSQDGDAEVRRESSARLASFPEQEMLGLLQDPAADTEVLDHFGAAAGVRQALREAVLANPATTPDTLRKMAPSFTAAEIDHLLLNQTRLIGAPDLLDLIEGNPSITPLQRNRVQEFRRHFLGWAPAPEAAPGPAAPAGGAPAPEAAPFAAAPAAAPSASAGPSEAPGEAVLDNATQKVLRMNTADKIQLAFKGNREERAILIKDSSKQVQEAVLQSPKVTENEVEAIAKMRSVTEEVLRIIAGNRDWMKNYTIVHALTTNPKTPAGLALNLVSRLNNRDLKIVAGDKNVSEVIRRQARKVVESRSQRPGGGGH